MVYDEAVRGTDSATPGARVAGGAGAVGREAGIRVEGLGKRYGELWALRGVDLEVAPGRVLGLLGHNGAGKTTMLRILTTLATPTTGRAWVAGHDVVAAPARVRARIGLAGQAATVDGLLTARANLTMVGRLYHLPAAAARRRADDLLEQFDLAANADQLAKTFSGGMRRRLDLAASLVAAPPVLFLDEPTTGLDPHSRNQLWQVLRDRVAAGTTLVLTTQYLEEADRLADDIVVLDHGAVVARGTPTELKARLGGERLVITMSDAAQLAPAQAALARFVDGVSSVEAAALQVIAPVRAGTRLIEVVRALDAAGLDAHDVQRRDVTLDDVFLALTRTPAAATGVATP